MNGRGVGAVRPSKHLGRDSALFAAWSNDPDQRRRLQRIEDRRADGAGVRVRGITAKFDYPSAKVLDFSRRVCNGYRSVPCRFQFAGDGFRSLFPGPTTVGLPIVFADDDDLPVAACVNK
ncbi:MAG TPA: hypothetical protein VI457_01170, partial [Methylococcaceae bacterium]|nr:hypothetical protein [Methylococcaceae bacterium]